MAECIFCQIANGKTGSLVWESGQVAAFNDANPSAPVHILVVPKAHLANLNQLDDPELAAELLMAIKAVAAQAGISKAYKVKFNNGRGAGQEVEHLHFHVKGQL